MSSQQLRNMAALKYQLEELANALEEEVKIRYERRSWFLPDARAQYDRDMEPVRNARKLLETLK